MEKEFVPVHIAHELKDLGFDEECIAVYSEGELLINELTLSIYNSSSRLFSNDCTAPLLSQVFRWFRKSYGLQHTIGEFNSYQDNYSEEFPYKYIVNSTMTYANTDSINKSGRCKTYEQAEQVCLEKMIQIVKGICQS